MAVITSKGEKMTLLNPIEWHDNVNRTYSDTIKVTKDADRIISESRELCNFMTIRDQEHQNNTTKHLAMRAQSVRVIQDELQQYVKSLIHETDLLLDQKSRLEKSLKTLNTVSYINSTCLRHRNERPAPDLVRDEVDVKLLKERGTVQQLIMFLERLLQATTEQIRINREQKNHLERDWSNKVEHYDLELTNVELAHHPEEGLVRLSCLAPRKSFTNESAWQEKSYSHMKNAGRELEISSHLRLATDRFLSEMAKDLSEGNDLINDALSQRLNELERSRHEFLNCQKEALQKSIRVENVIDSLKHQKRRQQTPMKIAQSRLYNRTTKPTQEIFEDSAFHRLKAEVEMLAYSKETLESKTAEAETTLAQLLNLRRQLDKDIATKEKSIFIDKERCRVMRNAFPDSIKLIGF